MNHDFIRERFFVESLELLSSYFSGPSVSLGARPIHIDREAKDPYLVFEEHVRLRYLLGVSLRLLNALKSIELNPSNRAHTSRMDSIGAIRGRLDTVRYIQRKISSGKGNRIYPVIRNISGCDTPENILARTIIGAAISFFNRSLVPKQCAEYSYLKMLRKELRAHIVREPWSNLMPSKSLHRLATETHRRLRRRQTGNQVAYESLLDVYQSFYGDRRWTGRAGYSGMTSDLILPQDPQFEDRIFEVWCLRELIESMKSIGMRCLGEMEPLYKRNKGPVAKFQMGKRIFEVFFQTGFSNSAASWRYLNSGHNLRGIPDILVKSSDGFMFLLDAKNRATEAQTRSEETYKILGYYENFSDILSSSGNWTALIFPSYSALNNTVVSRNQNRVCLLGAHPTDPEECAFRSNLVSSLLSWLDNARF